MSEPAQLQDPKASPTLRPVNAEPATRRAVVYLRVSTAEQAHGADSNEGYSIPAQREACQRRAADLGAVVVAEYADSGESAKTTARPQLQQMLTRLGDHKDVEYVIVHKIQLAIERAGARLISVTESVDDTPSGQLVRNIMADLAEFYSAWPPRSSRARPRKPASAAPPLGLRSVTSMCAIWSTAGRSAQWTSTRNGHS
jgi:hypothetical protein